MKLIKLLLFLVLLPVTAFRCEDVEPSVIQLSYETLDKNGNPSTQFREGENFIISFKIRNSSSEKIYYKRNHESNSDFATVFKLSGFKRVEEVGKPFPLQYPAVPRQGFHTIDPDSFIVYSFPWIYEEGLYNIPSSNKYINDEYPYNKTALPSGRYEISFTEDFQFSDDSDLQIEVNNRRFSHTFSIE